MVGEAHAFIYVVVILIGHTLPWLFFTWLIAYQWGIHLFSFTAVLGQLGHFIWSPFWVVASISHHLSFVSPARLVLRLCDAQWRLPHLFLGAEGYTSSEHK